MGYVCICVRVSVSVCVAGWVVGGVGVCMCLCVCVGVCRCVALPICLVCVSRTFVLFVSLSDRNELVRIFDCFHVCLVVSITLVLCIERVSVFACFHVCSAQMIRNKPTVNADMSREELKILLEQVPRVCVCVCL